MGGTELHLENNRQAGRQGSLPEWWAMVRMDQNETSSYVSQNG